MTIFTLDTGTYTGWALDNGKKLTSGNQDFTLDHDNGAKFIMFRAWFEGMCTIFKPDAVCYEMPHLRGSGTQLLVGFVTIQIRLSSTLYLLLIKTYLIRLQTVNPTIPR